MGLEKSIKYGKEKRKPFDKQHGNYCKSISQSCRNNGSCPYCKKNRTHKNDKREFAKEQELRDFQY